MTKNTPDLLWCIDQLGRSIEEHHSAATNIMNIQRHVAYTVAEMLGDPKPTWIGCSHERPTRKTLCQLKKGHDGSHQAMIYWEDQ